MIRGLWGLMFLCSAAGFTGPISTLSRSAGCRRDSCGTSCDFCARQKTLQPGKGWHSIKQQRVRTKMIAAEEGDTEASPSATAPRLKRVRRRRKDGASVAVSEETEDAAISFDSSRVAAADTAAAASTRVPTPLPPVVITQPPPPVAAQHAGDEENDAPPSQGGTKGTKVRVVDTSDDDMSERLAGVASAASGAAGDAASAIGGAARSALGAVMLALGRGPPPAAGTSGPDTNGASVGGGEGQQRRAGGGRKRTTPGKSAAELAELGADIERFRRAESRQPETAGESIASGAKGVISTIISIDFFVVIVFMLWFIAGVVSSYGFGDTFLLDQFNDKWTPVVQPALGVLMGGTIAGGVVSKLGESGNDDDGNRPPGPRGI